MSPPDLKRPPVQLCHGRRAGLTLVEMVMSLIVTAFLIVACSLALRLAFRTLEPAAQEANAASYSSEAAGDLVTDLNLATKFTERSATAVTVSVPDRTGDGEDEVIRYAWSGAAGDATQTPAVPAYTLTRKVNGGAWTALAKDAQAFELTYLTRAAAGVAATPGPYGNLILGIDPTDGTSNEFSVTLDNWVGMGFRPPASFAFASSWTLDRVRLKLRQDLTLDGVLKIQVRRADALYRPIGTSLDEVTIPEVQLTSASEWIEVTFTRLTNLSPSQNYAVIVSGVISTGTYCRVASVAASLQTALAGYYTTSANRGVSWTLPVGTTQLRAHVYGRAN